MSGLVTKLPSKEAQQRNAALARAATDRHQQVLIWDDVTVEDVFELRSGIHLHIEACRAAYPEGYPED